MRFSHDSSPTTARSSECAPEGESGRRDSRRRAGSNPSTYSKSDETPRSGLRSGTAQSAVLARDAAHPGRAVRIALLSRLTLAPAALVDSGRVRTHDQIEQISCRHVVPFVGPVVCHRVKERRFGGGRAFGCSNSATADSHVHIVIRRFAPFANDAPNCRGTQRKTGSAEHLRRGVGRRRPLSASPSTSLMRTARGSTLAIPGLLIG